MTKSLDRDLPRAEVAPAEPPSNGARPVSTGTEAEPAPGPGWGLPLAVLIVGMFMSILDLSIVNVAIRRSARISVPTSRASSGSVPPTA